jgi:hypothetical protein
MPEAEGAGRALRGVLSKMEGPTAFCLRRAKERDVTMKTVARTTVTFVKKGVAPRAPNMEELDPPIMTPVSAPFPDWRRTAAMIRKHVTT